MFKDDFLYISYQHPISSCPLLDIYLSSPDSKLYDEVIFGGIIPHFLRFAEQYSLYDCSSIWSQIEEKRAWLKANYPTDYRLIILAAILFWAWLSPHYDEFGSKILNFFRQFTNKK